MDESADSNTEITQTQLADSVANVASLWSRLNGLCRKGLLFFRQPLFGAIAAVAGVVGFVVVVATGWQIWNDYVDRQEDRIDRAWTRLLRPMSGNTGKADAFEFLTLHRVSLSDTDLSCRAIGSFDASAGRCAKRPVFEGLELSYRDQGLVILDGIEFDEVEIGNSQFVQIALNQIDFQQAFIHDTKIIHSYLHASGRDAIFANSSFRGSLLAGSFLVEAQFTSVDISNTIFWTIPTDRLAGAWAWADAPPRTLDRSGSGSKQELVPLLNDGKNEVTLCRVPHIEGQPQPIHARPISVRCEPVPSSAAKELYPESYKSVGEQDIYARWGGIVFVHLKLQPIADTVEQITHPELQ